MGKALDESVRAATGDVHAPSSNTAAVVTYAAVSGVRHVVTGIAWSYLGDDPTGGNLKIEDGAGNVVFTMGISAEGAGMILFPRPKRGGSGNAMIVTLAAGGVSVTGKVSVLNHWSE